MNNFIFLILISLCYIIIEIIIINNIELENEYDVKSWMGLLSDNLTIDNIWIPAATSHQEVGVYTMLYNGVRGFENLKEEDIKIIKIFLTIYPTEFIFNISNEESSNLTVIKDMRGKILPINKKKVISLGTWRLMGEGYKGIRISKIFDKHDLLPRVYQLDAVHFNHWNNTNKLILKNKVPIKKYFIIM